MILGTSRAVRVFAYPEAIDLRKGYDGLFGLVKQGLSRDPLSGERRRGKRKAAQLLARRSAASWESPSARRRRAGWAMSNLQRWWDGRSDGAKVALGIVGGLAVVATGGALAYAAATGGIIVASGETVILVGAATSLREPDRWPGGRARGVSRS